MIGKQGGNIFFTAYNAGWLMRVRDYSLIHARAYPVSDIGFDLYARAERVYVAPDCGLRTRTWEVVYEKLENIVKGAELAREAV